MDTSLIVQSHKNSFQPLKKDPCQLRFGTAILMMLLVTLLSAQYALADEVIFGDLGKLIMAEGNASEPGGEQGIIRLPGSMQLFFTAPRANKYYSRDFRVAGFGAQNGGLRISKNILTNNNISKSLRFEVGLEYTEHVAGLQPGNNSSSSLTDFNSYVVTASIRFSF